MKKTQKVRQSGITLIALIITIVVLIILATITINIAFGDGGLIQRAQTAKELTEQGKQDEQSGLNDMVDMLEGKGLTGNSIGTGGTQEPTGPKPEISIEIEEGTDKVTIKVTATEEENGIESIKLVDQEDEREYDITTGEAEESFDVYENGEYTVEVTTNTGVTATETVEISSIVTDPVAKIGDTEYETLRKAIEAVPEGQNTTIEIMRNYNQTVIAEIPSGKDVSLDLKNYTMTLTTGALRNCGKLEIKTTDGSQSGKIELQNSNYTGIFNKGGELQITSGTYNTNVAVNTIQNSGKMTITGGQINGTTQQVEGLVFPTVWNSGNGELSVNGGTITSTTGLGLMNAENGITIIDGATISGTTSAINNNADGTVTINSGTIQSSAANTIGNFGKGSVIINGGQVIGATELSSDGKSNPTIYNLVGNIQVNNGATVGSTTSIAILNMQIGTISIDGGNVTSTNNATILNAADGTVNIKNGTISSSENVAIQNDGSGNVTIESGNITTTSAPSIMNRANGNITTAANVQATNHSAIQNTSTGSITINGGQVNGALQASDSGYYPTILNDNTGTVNVTGGTVDTTTGVALYNSAGGNIILDGGTVTASASGMASAANLGSGNITVKSGTINTTSCTLDRAGIQNAGTGSVNIEGGTIYTKEGISLWNTDAGNITISGGEINPTVNYAVANLGSGNITISNGIINGATMTDQYGNYPTIASQSQSTGTITITGGTIKSTTSMAILNYDLGHIIINGGTIGDASIAIVPVANVGSGEITIQNGLMQSDSNTIVNTGTGIIRIQNGTIAGGTNAGSGNPCVYNQSTGEIIIEGGSITGSTGATAIYNEATGKITVTGGRIQSYSQVITNNDNAGIITVGIDDGVVSTTSPELIAGENTNPTCMGGIINFYDGVLKGYGLTNDYAVQINLPSGYRLNKDTSKTLHETTLVAN